MASDIPPPPWNRNPWDGDPDLELDLAEEIQQLQRMVASDPENLDLQEWLGFKLYSGSRFKQAEKIYRFLLDRKHRPGVQAFYLGNVLHKLGRNDEAVEFWTMTVELLPGDPKSTKAAARIEKVRASGSGST